MELVSPTENQEQPAQIYDIDKGEFVDNPLLKSKEKTSEESEEEVEEEEEEVEVPNDKKKKSKEEKESEDTEEEEESETETEEEPAEEEEESETEEESEDDGLSPDAYIKSIYGEKYGVETQEDLDEVVDKALNLMDEHEALKKAHDQLRAESGKPKFTSEKQQKAFEFLSQFDVDRQGEALDTYAKLISMDVDNADPLMILEERFVHEHPEWTRAEAQRMFKKDYAKKYSPKRESFGTDAEYEEEIADLKIAEKGEVARAKSYLKEQKTKYKPADKEQPKSNEAVVKAIEKTGPEYEQHINKTKDIVFQDGGDEYKFKLNAEQHSKVSEAMMAWVKNPASYDDKGVFTGVNPDEMYKMVVGSLFLPEIVSAIKDQVKNKVSIKRAEEIGEKSPKKRSSPGAGDAKMKNDDLDAQALRIIKKRAS